MKIDEADLMCFFVLIFSNVFFRVYLKDSNDLGIPIMNGSIRSASTISSSKECDKNAGLVR